MKRAPRDILVLLSSMMLLLPNAITPATASPFILGTGTLTLVSSHFTLGSGCPSSLQSLVVTYRDNVFTADIYIYAAIHNTMGQTVSIANVSATISVGQDVTACLNLSGLQPGTYNASMFATTQTYYADTYYRGVALSVVNAMVFTAS
jgi:hypothetical protein